MTKERLEQISRSASPAFPRISEWVPISRYISMELLLQGQLNELLCYVKELEEKINNGKV